jgi:predicted transcriptional regulator
MRDSKKSALIEARISEDLNVVLESLARTRRVSKSMLIREALMLLVAVITYKATAQSAIEILKDLRGNSALK